jgi:hypothetical protein
MASTLVSMFDEYYPLLLLLLLVLTLSSLLSNWDYFVPVTGSDYPLVPLSRMETIFAYQKPPMPFVMAWTPGKIVIIVGMQCVALWGTWSVGRPLWTRAGTAQRRANSAYIGAYLECINYVLTTENTSTCRIGTSTHLFRLQKTHPVFEEDYYLRKSIDAVTDERGKILGTAHVTGPLSPVSIFQYSP